LNDEPCDNSETPGPPTDRSWIDEDRGGYFTKLIGPIYVSHEALDPGEPVRFGFRVSQQHCNPRLVCHGGMLASMLDLVLACALLHSPGVKGPLPTISMTLDYLAPAHCGEWIESRVTVLRVGGSVGFAQALLHGPGGIVLRGSGVFKRTRRITT
jgi:uncharacterized protein (TIGR00369 family)